TFCQMQTPTVLSAIAVSTYVHHPYKDPHWETSGDYLTSPKPTTKSPAAPCGVFCLKRGLCPACPAGRLPGIFFKENGLAAFAADAHDVNAAQAGTPMAVKRMRPAR